jgi:phosphate-selective porin
MITLTLPSTRAVRPLLPLLLLLLTSRPVVAQSAQEARPAQTPVFEVNPRGYLQFDWRGYPDWPIVPGGGRLEYDTFDVRRARIGVDGRWRRVSFEVAVDPQDFDDDTVVKDAYGQFRFSRALRVRIGQFKLPGGREYMTSARTADFIERSALSNSADAGRDLGGMLTGAVGKRLEYEVGVFAGDGRGRASRAGVTSAGRLTWTAVKDLEIGASSSLGRTSAHDSEPANGLGGRTPSGYRFFERLYVHGRRQRLGVDAAFTPRSWTFAAEGLYATDQRLEQGLDFEDLPSIVATGWSAEVRHRFGRGRGDARVRAREIDLGVRFDQLSFDDSAAATGRDSVRLRATDVRERGAGTLTAGISWRPTRWSRILGNASLERYADARSAPEAGKGTPYLTLSTRFQIELP